MSEWLQRIIIRAKNYDLFESVLGANSWSMDYNINIVYPKHNKPNKYRKPVESGVAFEHSGDSLHACPESSNRTCNCQPGSCAARDDSTSGDRDGRTNRARTSSTRDQGERRSSTWVWDCY